MINRMRPLSVRRAALKGFSEGRTLRDIATECKVSAPAVQKWAKEAGVAKGVPLTDDELDAIIEAWSANHRAMEIRGENTQKKQAIRDKKLRHKFGATSEEKQKAVASFKELGDPDEYKAAIQEQFTRSQSLMTGAMSPQDHAKGMMTGILLVQTQEIISNPPPVTSWADAERVFKLLRLTLGMDREESGNSERADLRLLNAKIDDPKIIELDANGQPPKRRRKNAS